MKFIHFGIRACLCSLFLITFPFTGLLVQSKMTVCGTSFFFSALDQLDPLGYVGKLAAGQLSKDDRARLGTVIDSVIRDNRSIIQDELRNAIYRTSQYLTSDAPRLSFTIRLDTLRHSTETELRGLFGELAAKQLKELSPEERKQALDEMVNDAMKDIPIPPVITEADLPKEIIRGLETARPFITLAEITAKWALLGSITLFGLIWWQGSLRMASVMLIISGAVCRIVGRFVEAGTFENLRFMDRMLPEEMATTLEQGVLNEYMEPLYTFATAALVIGAVLFIAAFWLRRRSSVYKPVSSSA